mgnify:CR=1 FL=1
MDFNPRAYVRHDKGYALPMVPTNFNPRAYVRHDVRGRAGRPGGTYFNPRAYVRHDLLGIRPKAGPTISIHVPT